MKNNLRIAAIALALVMVTSVMLSGTLAKYTSEFAGQDTALVARWDFAAEGEEDEWISGNTPTDSKLDLFGHAYNKHITQKDGDDYIIAPGVEGDFTVEFKYTGDVDAAITLKLALDAASDERIPIQYSLKPFTTAEPDDIYYDLDVLAEEMLEQLHYKNQPTSDPKPVPASDYSEWSTIDGTADEFDDVILGSDEIEPPRVQASDGVPENTVVITKTNEDNTTYVSIPVYWRWPYDTDSDGTIKAKLLAAGFTAIDVADPGTHAYDTALGKASADAGERLKYILNVNVIATQVQPKAE